MQENGGESSEYISDDLLNIMFDNMNIDAGVTRSVVDNVAPSAGLATQSAAPAGLTTPPRTQSGSTEQLECVKCNSPCTTKSGPCRWLANKCSHRAHALWRRQHGMIDKGTQTD